jgi:hypothetical protein
MNPELLLDADAPLHPVELAVVYRNGLDILHDRWNKLFTEACHSQSYPAESLRLSAIGVCLSDAYIRIDDSMEAYSVADRIPEHNEFLKYRDTALMHIGVHAIFELNSELLRTVHNSIRSPVPRRILRNSAVATFSVNPRSTREDALHIAEMNVFEDAVAENPRYHNNSVRPVSLKIDQQQLQKVISRPLTFSSQKDIEIFNVLLHEHPESVNRLDLCIALLENASLSQLDGEIVSESLLHILGERTLHNQPIIDHVQRVLELCRSTEEQLFILQYYVGISPREYQLLFSLTKDKPELFSSLFLTDHRPIIGREEYFVNTLAATTLDRKEVLEKLITFLSVSELYSWLPGIMTQYWNSLHGHDSQRESECILRSIPDASLTLEQKEATAQRIVEYLSSITEFSEYDKAYLDRSQQVELVNIRFINWHKLISTLWKSQPADRLKGYSAFYQLGWNRFRLSVSRSFDWKPETVVSMLQDINNLHPDDVDAYLLYRKNNPITASH